MPPGKHLCMYTAVPGGNFISVPVSRPRLQTPYPGPVFRLRIRARLQILSTWSLHLPQSHWPFPSPVRFTSGFFMSVFISHHCRSLRPHRPQFRLLWALWQRPGTAVVPRMASRGTRPASLGPHRPLSGLLWALWQRPGTAVPSRSASSSTCLWQAVRATFRMPDGLTDDSYGWYGWYGCMLAGQAWSIDGI